MKSFFKSLVFVLLVGGWALASAAIQVIRTPSSIVVVPKDRLGYHDTYLDTRNWTVADDRSHPELVTRLVRMGRTDVLAHTIQSTGKDPQAMLIEMGVHPK